MRRFAPALCSMVLIAAGIAGIWTWPWRLPGGAVVWAVLVLVVASKLVAIGLAIRRSRRGT